MTSIPPGVPPSQPKAGTGNPIHTQTPSPEEEQVPRPPIETPRGRRAKKPKQPEEYLPAVAEYVPIRPFQGVDETYSEDEIKKIDIQIANNMLEVLHFSFGAARSIKSVTSLVSTTMRTLQQRRDILYKNDSKNKNTTAYPVIPLD